MIDWMMRLLIFDQLTQVKPERQDGNIGHIHRHKVSCVQLSEPR